MQEELNKIIEMAKKKYNISEERTTTPIFLVIHDDGSEYVQEADDGDLYGIDGASGHVAGDEFSGSGYKAIIKLRKSIYDEE